MPFLTTPRAPSLSNVVASGPASAPLPNNPFLINPKIPLFSNVVASGPAASPLPTNNAFIPESNPELPSFPYSTSFSGSFIIG